MKPPVSPILLNGCGVCGGWRVARATIVPSGTNRSEVDAKFVKVLKALTFVTPMVRPCIELGKNSTEAALNAVAECYS